MLSGNCARGSSSAPASGKTGIVGGNSCISRSRLIGLGPSIERASDEQQRGKTAAALDRRLVIHAPDLEELQKLLAGAVVVPFAVALDDLDQLIGRVAALAAGVEREQI